MMEIGAIAPELVEEAWPLIEPLITPALDYDFTKTTAEDIKDKIQAGEYGCLVVIDDEGKFIAAQTAQIFDQENGERMLNLVTTAGYRLNEWQDLLADAIDNLARSMGCQVIQTRGRLGWLKALRRNGYQPLYFTAEKRVDYGQEQNEIDDSAELRLDVRAAS
jgi:hypothetical protein